MDILILSVINGDVNKMMYIIQNSNISTNEYINLMNYFMFFYIKKRINTVNIFNLIYLILRRYQLVKYNEVDITLESNEMNDGDKLYVYLEIYTRLHENVIMISNFLCKLIASDGEIKYYFITNNVPLNEMKHKLYEIISSYNDKYFCNNIYKNKNKILALNESINWHSMEIENRLRLIVEKFGLIFLRSIKVNIISNVEFNKMVYSEKVKYYKLCICKLQKFYKKFNFLLEQKELIDNEMCKLDLYFENECKKIEY